MVRPRVELRLIEDRTSRLTRFSKRRAGLLKKARELAVLCDAEICLFVISPLGKPSHFSSRGSTEKTIQHYQSLFETETGIKKHAGGHESQPKGFLCQKMNSELLDVAQRLSEGQGIENLNAIDLERLQKQLAEELSKVRDTMMELKMNTIKRLKDKEKALLQERRKLRLALGMNVHEREGGHTQRRKCAKNRFWKEEEDAAEQCDGDGAVKADTALRLWCSEVQQPTNRYNAHQ